MKAYTVTYRRPGSRKQLTAARYYHSMTEAIENCQRVLGDEQGYIIVSITEQEAA